MPKTELLTPERLKYIAEEFSGCEPMDSLLAHIEALTEHNAVLKADLEMHKPAIEIGTGTAITNWPTETGG